MGILLFFLILEKKDVLAVSLSYTAFIMLKYVLSISSFCIYWDDHLIFIFHSFNVVYHIYWCVCAELLPGIDPVWSWYMIPLTCYWIWFASILLRSFTSIFIKDIGRLFFCSILIWLWYQGNAHLMSLGVFPLQIFGKSLRKIGITSLFSRIHQWNHLILGFSLLGDFDYWFKIFILYWFVQIFPFLPDSILVSHMFLGIYPFFQVVQFVGR